MGLSLHRNTLHPGALTNTATATGIGTTGIQVVSKARATVTIGVTATSGCTPPKVKVPYLIYLTEAEALAELATAQLDGHFAERIYSDTFPPGQVISHDPVDGACVDPKTMVNLLLLLGPEPKREAKVTPAKLSAELDCGDSFELTPGGMGRSCGIIVRGWRSKTEDRVEVRIEYNKRSGITVSPGDTSAPPSLMYTAGVVSSSDAANTYVLSESFKARGNAPEGETTITIKVRQKGASEVTLTLNVAVLPKGQRPSSERAVCPPPTGYSGKGGKFCVWRHQLLYHPPNCFEFATAECNSPFYNPPRWELEGRDMVWEEADALLTRLSRFAGNAYGCDPFKGKDDKKPPKDDTPDQTTDEKPTEYPEDDVKVKGCDGDRDCDGIQDDQDKCPDDGEKAEPGHCGCGVTETGDTDGDGTHDCNDSCPKDIDKVEPGECGCGVPDSDSDEDGTYDCIDNCPKDIDKIDPGECGCGVPDSDSDEDGTPDCKDDCPQYDPTNPACDPEAESKRKPATDPNIGDDFQSQTPWGKKPQEGTGVVGGGDQPIPQPPAYTGEEEKEEIDEPEGQAGNDPPEKPTQTRHEGGFKPIPGSGQNQPTSAQKPDPAKHSNHLKSRNPVKRLSHPLRLRLIFPL